MAAVGISRNVLVEGSRALAACGSCQDSRSLHLIHRLDSDFKSSTTIPKHLTVKKPISA